MDRYVRFSLPALSGGSFDRSVVALLRRRRAGADAIRRGRSISSPAIRPAAPPISSRARIGQPLSVRLGQSVVIDNRPGANGNISAEVVAKAAPDGYTLLYANDSLVVVNPHIYSKMSVNLMQDLVPVVTTISNQLVLAVNPQGRSGQRLPGLCRVRPQARHVDCSMPRSATAAITTWRWKC